MDAPRSPHESYTSGHAAAPGSSFFTAPTQEESLARLHFLADRRQRLGLLRGPAGCGKTWVLRRFSAERRRAGDDVALIDLLGADGRELLWQLASRFNARVAPLDPRFTLWRTISNHLLENHLQQIPTTILLDNVDQATDEVGGLVLRLLHPDVGCQPRLSIVLSIDEGGTSRLEPRLIDLVDLAMEIEPWSEADVASYLVRRLAHHGMDSPTIAKGAASRAWQLTTGNPRQVIRLIELALLASATQSKGQIDAGTLDQVCRELTALPAAA